MPPCNRLICCSHAILSTPNLATSATNFSATLAFSRRHHLLKLGIVRCENRSSNDLHKSSDVATEQISQDQRHESQEESNSNQEPDNQPSQCQQKQHQEQSAQSHHQEQPSESQQQQQQEQQEQPEQQPEQPPEEQPSPSSQSQQEQQPPQNGFRPTSPTFKTVQQLDAFRFMELVGPEKVDPEDVKLLKDKVFGYTTYWVTGQEAFGALGEGVLLLGNLRGQREQVFAKLQQGVANLLGSKYDLFMVEEPNSQEPDPRGGPRVSFLLLRREASQSPPTSAWQYVVAALLVFLTAGSCLQLGIATQLQVSKLPPEIVQYFTSPESTEPPDLQLLLPYFESALPLAYGVFGVNLFHEVGHRLAAAPLNVELGIPYFIPNITLGSFGAITQFKSICPDRKSKFDISMAGPLAGGLLSVAMVGVGLLLSLKGPSDPTLVQVPSLVFQGSLLLGLVSRAVLGYDAMHSATVTIHPLVIAGWCGVTTTAFNLLPVGCIDGGRAFQAAFGTKLLRVSGLITYVLLGLGVLGGPLSLPWGLYILIVQRSAEKACLNDVSGIGIWRQLTYVITLGLVLATLLPLGDGFANQLGIGPGTGSPDVLDLI